MHIGARSLKEKRLQACQNTQGQKSCVNMPMNISWKCRCYKSLSINKKIMTSEMTLLSDNALIALRPTRDAVRLHVNVH